MSASEFVITQLCFSRKLFHLLCILRISTDCNGFTLLKQPLQLLYRGTEAGQADACSRFSVCCPRTLSLSFSDYSVVRSLPHNWRGAGALRATRTCCLKTVLHLNGQPVKTVMTNTRNGAFMLNVLAVLAWLTLVKTTDGKSHGSVILDIFENTAEPIRKVHRWTAPAGHALLTSCLSLKHAAS